MNKAEGQDLSWPAAFAEPRSAPPEWVAHQVEAGALRLRLFLPTQWKVASALSAAEMLLTGEPILGAQAMLDDGMYTKQSVPPPDYLLGLHTAPIPTGTMGAAGGTREAGCDQMVVTVFGVGRHGSTPQFAKDPRGSQRDRARHRGGTGAAGKRARP